MNMQTQQQVSFVTPNAFHVKVQFNEEFRRFSLQDPSFSTLEATLRDSFQIPNGLALKLKFQDDEKDWVVFSSDVELQHALELSGSPLRLTIVFDKPEVALKPKSQPVAVDEPCRRGPCGGRGGRFASLSKEEREAFKKTRISTRISLLESQLAEPSLSSERERAITWKLSKLREKLERQEDEPEIERPWRHHHMLHHDVEGGHPHEHPHGPCRGRGGRGRGCGGRGRWTREAAAEENAEDGDHILGKNWVVPKQTWMQFQESKENLRAARRSGDAEAVKKALEVFEAAKQLKKEHRYPKVQ